MSIRPTTQYLDLQKAYDIMNGALFAAELPDVMITLATRSKNTMGYYREFGFESRDNSGSFVGEICLNPASFHYCTDEKILSTLLHEMTHVWQAHFGKTSRNGYHNKQWGKQMIAVGLHPSETGQPGGKETGQSMSHYVIDNGPFSDLVTKLHSQQIHIAWQTPNNEPNPNTIAPGKPTTKKPGSKATKTKYTCPDCSINVWGKGGLKLACVECDKCMASN